MATKEREAVNIIKRTVKRVIEMMLSLSHLFRKQRLLSLSSSSMMSIDQQKRFFSQKSLQTKKYFSPTTSLPSFLQEQLSLSYFFLFKFFPSTFSSFHQGTSPVHVLHHQMFHKFVFTPFNCITYQETIIDTLLEYATFFILIYFT